MSNTPRTDAALLGATHWGRVKAWTCKGHTIVPADFARQLEREITELKAALEMGQRNCDDVYNDLRAALATATESAQLYRGRAERYEQRMAEMAKDKARLDWLDSVTVEHAEKVIGSQNPHDLPTVRAAIDAAMKDDTK